MIPFQFFVFRVANILPVSYTHLDVYKRQLQDITLWPDYGTLCGITLQELLDTFQPEIKILAANNSISYDDAVQR